MSKQNHFMCPNCGHDFYDDGAYTTCDACQTFFYASQSRTCQPQPSKGYYDEHGQWWQTTILGTPR